MQSKRIAFCQKTSTTEVMPLMQLSQSGYQDRYEFQFVLGVDFNVYCKVQCAGNIKYLPLSVVKSTIANFDFNCFGKRLIETVFSRLSMSKDNKCHMPSYEFIPKIVRGDVKEVTIFPKLEAAGRERFGTPAMNPFYGMSIAQVIEYLDSYSGPTGRFNRDSKISSDSKRGEKAFVTYTTKDNSFKYVVDPGTSHIADRGTPFKGIELPHVDAQILDVSDPSKYIYSKRLPLGDGPKISRPEFEKLKRDLSYDPSAAFQQVKQEALNQLTSSASSPSLTTFANQLDANGIRQSFDAINPRTLPPSTSNLSGQIGGVAQKIGIIEGLSGSWEDLLDKVWHAVFIKYSNFPFSKEELGQIIREMANAVNNHDQVPFFSLHFNGKLQQFLVMHPAFWDTIVGEVLMQTDYLMKCFLNGRFFPLAFLNEWEKSPITDGKYLGGKTVEFRNYCRDHLGSGYRYLSLRDRLKRAGVGDADTVTIDGQSHVLASLFEASFRMIFELKVIGALLRSLTLADRQIADSLSVASKEEPMVPLLGNPSFFSLVWGRFGRNIGNDNCFYLIKNVCNDRKIGLAA